MIREVYCQVQAIRDEASDAKSSAYNRGYLDALALVIETIEAAAWDNGVDLDS